MSIENVNPSKIFKYYNFLLLINSAFRIPLLNKGALWHQHKHTQKCTEPYQPISLSTLIVFGAPSKKIPALSIRRGECP